MLHISGRCILLNVKSNQGYMQQLIYRTFNFIDKNVLNVIKYYEQRCSRTNRAAHYIYGLDFRNLFYSVRVSETFSIDHKT